MNITICNARPRTSLEVLGLLDDQWKCATVHEANVPRRASKRSSKLAGCKLQPTSATGLRELQATEEWCERVPPVCSILLFLKSFFSSIANSFFGSLKSAYTLAMRCALCGTYCILS